MRLQAEADGLEGWEFVLEKPGEWLLLSAIWLPFSGLAVMNLFSEYGSLRDGLLWMIPTVCGLHRLWSGWCGLRKVRYSEEKQRMAVYMLKQQLLQMMDEFGKATGLPILER